MDNCALAALLILSAHLAFTRQRTGRSDTLTLVCSWSRTGAEAELARSSYDEVADAARLERVDSWPTSGPQLARRRRWWRSWSYRLSARCRGTTTGARWDCDDASAESDSWPIGDGTPASSDRRRRLPRAVDQPPPWSTVPPPPRLPSVLDVLDVASTWRWSARRRAATERWFACPPCKSVAEWLACWTQALKGPGSNRSRDDIG